MMKFSLMGGVALVSMLAMPTLAVAQETAEAEEDTGIATILVTARKVSENLQSTPVAVSAFSGESLANQQVVGIQEIQALTPNITFSSAVAQPGSSTVFIRGQGSSDGLIAIDQAVGVYLDGVYAARSTGGATDLLDVSRVEVLRGPQGTLFGRNTTGGAINIIANRPTDEFEGSARVDYGNFNAFLAQGVLNLPMGESFALRAAFQHRQRDGFGRNVTLDRPLNDLNSEFGRLTFAITPVGSKFSAIMTADYSSFNNSGELVGLRSYNPTLSTNAPDLSANPTISPFVPTELLAAACGTQPIPAGLPPATAGFLGGLKSGAIPLCPAITPRPGPVSTYALGGANNPGFFNQAGNVPAFGRNSTYGASGVLEYEFSDAARIKSTTAWRGVRLSSLTDNDGTPYQFSGGRAPVPGNQIDQDQFSQELQLTGDLGSFEYILGGFYFVENGTDNSDSGSLFPLSPNINSIDSVVRNESIAVFGQVIFDVTDSIRLTGGIRYTEDQRELVLRNRDTNVLTGAVTSSLILTAPDGTILDDLRDGDPSDPFRGSFDRSFNYWSYLVSADWQASDNLFFYAKTSRSQRSGGLNTRAVAGGIPQVGFDPEIVTDYEVGAKIDLLGRRVRLNLAAFNADIDNLQRNVIGVGNGRLVSGVENAAAATIRGFEAELTVAPATGLTFGSNLGYTDAKYNEFTNLDGSDWSGAEFAYTPEFTLALFGDYSVDVGPGTLKLHADYSWRSEAFANSIQASAPQRLGRTAAQIQQLNDALQATAEIPSYGLLNARIAYEFNDPQIEVAVFGRNITQEQFFSRLLAVQGTALGFTSYMPGDPRTYGVSVSVAF
jgi:iron complex outermembrane recepter protein